MNLYDVFAFFGIFISIASLRFIFGFIIGTVLGSSTEEETLYSWLIDILVTSVLVAGAIVYMIKTGRISVV